MLDCGGWLMRAVFCRACCGGLLHCVGGGYYGIHAQCYTVDSRNTTVAALLANTKRPTAGSYPEQLSVHTCILRTKDSLAVEIAFKT
jgi:hypothetical protein